MSEQITQSLPHTLQASSSSNFNTFTCFPNLPAEIRILIWEAAVDNFEKRRVMFMKCSDRSPFPAHILDVRLVSFDVRKIFDKTYKKLFAERREEPLLFHPEKEILRLGGGVRGLDKMIRCYPESMRLLCRVEIIAFHSCKARRNYIDLSYLSPECKLIVISAIENCPFDGSGMSNTYDCSLNMVRTLEWLQHCLLRQKLDVILAAVFPTSAYYRCPVYFEASKGAQKARYGRIKGGYDLDGQCTSMREPFRIKWVRKDAPWPARDIIKDEVHPKDHDELWEQLCLTRIPCTPAMYRVHVKRRVKAGLPILRTLGSVQMLRDFNYRPEDLSTPW